LSRNHKTTQATSAIAVTTARAAFFIVSSDQNHRPAKNHGELNGDALLQEKRERPPEAIDIGRATSGPRAVAPIWRTLGLHDRMCYE